MKKVYVILAAVILSGCANMGASMGTSGMGSGSGYSVSSQEPVFNRPFDPNDPYHGG